jgi:hypothetical protein
MPTWCSRSAQRTKDFLARMSFFWKRHAARLTLIQRFLGISRLLFQSHLCIAFTIDQKSSKRYLTRRSYVQARAGIHEFCFPTRCKRLETSGGLYQNGALRPWGAPAPVRNREDWSVVSQVVTENTRSQQPFRSRRSTNHCPLLHTSSPQIRRILLTKANRTLSVKDGSTATFLERTRESTMLSPDKCFELNKQNDQSVKHNFLLCVCKTV